MNLKNIIIVFLFVLMVAQLASAQSNYNKLDKLRTNDLITEKFDVQSVTNGSKPCPAMTQDQRNAIASPIEGQCIYNSVAKTLNLYNGTAWVEVAGGGGEGGIAKWVADKLYEIDDVVIEGNEIYSCVEEHVSGVSFDGTKFQILAKDLSVSTGVLSMSNGGTSKALTPQLGGVVYTDAGSMEVLPFGVLGKFLKSNGEAAPSWEDVPSTEVNDASFSGVLSLAKGGTNKELVANNGAIAYSSETSLELLAPGSAGQVLQSNGVGAPSFTNQAVKAKSQSGSVVTLEEIQVPSNQLTKIDTNKHMIETGSGNLLSNPGFEHEVFYQGWDNVFTGDAVLDYNIYESPDSPLDGKKSLELVCNGTAGAGTCTFFQDAATAYSFQGMVQAKIKSDSPSGVKLWSRVDGVNSISKDITSIEAGIVPIPQPLGTTSTGIALEITVALGETKKVLLDSAFVGAQDVKQDVSTCNSIECETEFSAFVGATGTVSGENYDFLSGNCTNHSAGVYSCSFNAGIFSESPVCQITTGNRRALGASTSTAILSLSMETVAGTVSNSPFVVTCTRSDSDFTNAKRLAGGSIYSTASDSFSTDTNTLTHKPSVAITAADPIGTFNTFSYAANTNTKTICTAAPSTAPTKADGFRIFTRAFNAASTCGNPSRIELKIAQPGTSLPTLSKEIYKNTGKLLSGEVNFYPGGTSIDNGFLIQGYSSSNGVIVMDSGLASSGSITSHNFLFNDNSAATSGYLVINAQKMKDAIVGDFTNIEKCADDYECTDTFSAKVGATGIVSDENLDWVQGNASISLTSLYRVNFKSEIFTTAPNCTATISLNTSAAADRNIIIKEVTSSYVDVFTSTTGSSIAYAFSLTCQKQGADYKPKTAKIANPEALNYVYVEAAGNAGQTMTAGVTNVPFIEITDTNNSWDGSTFTVPVDGIYNIKTSMFFTVDTNRGIHLYVNGADTRRMNFQTSGVSAAMQAEYSGYFTQGATVSLRTTSGTTHTLSNNISLHYLTITRIPGQF